MNEFDTKRYALIISSPIHLGPATYQWDGIRYYALTDGPDVLAESYDLPFSHIDGYTHSEFVARIRRHVDGNA